MLARLKKAKTAALKAGKRIREYYDASKSQKIKVHHKSPFQPVTEADLEANRIIKNELSEFFTTDAWLSEEDEDDGKRFQADRVWIVDPLDGTYDFIHRNPEFTVSIGLAQNQKPVLGVIYNPITDELFWAAKDHGAFLNNTAISALPFAAKTDFSLLVSRSEYRRGLWKNYQNDFNLVPTGGSAYKLALVAAGKSHGAGTFQPKSEWDVCAGAAILKEADGALTNHQGSELVFNKKDPLFQSLFYTHKENHSDFLEKIRKYG